MPESLKIMQQVLKWRREGLEVYFTVNTGQDIHIICRKSDIEKLEKRLSQIPEIKKIIPNLPSKGVRLTSQHLF
jgi:mevalonate pyrophosphate decarboxylase